MIAGRWWAGLLAGLAMATWEPVGAKVGGPCANCHTMHYSQGGGVPVQWGRTGPYRALLVSDCVGCHSSTGSNTTRQLGPCAVPVVLCAQEPTYPPNGSSSSCLAGGNFWWLVNEGDQYGHNVLAIPGVSEDPNNPGPPGGFRSPDRGSCGYCHGGNGSQSWLCDCTSCHVPRHHADDHPGGGHNNVVDESGGFYRFLGRQKDNYVLPPGVWNNVKGFHNNAGVKGVEDPDWEQTCSATDHNEYAGETAHPGSLSGGYESISDWCGGCHGDFHRLTDQGAVGSASPWLRHPTDFKLGDATGTEYLYNTPDGASFGPYVPLVPVARADIDAYDGSGPSSAVTGEDQVQCLSCHRAHGSPYPDMLRWDYRSWPGGGTNGCAVCHTSKD